MTTVFIKAQGYYPKGQKPSEVWLDKSSVSKAMGTGLREGQKITVKVKVGKKRKLFKAYFIVEREQCCSDHSSYIMGYRAERIS